MQEPTTSGVVCAMAGTASVSVASGDASITAGLPSLSATATGTTDHPSTADEVALSADAEVICGDNQHSSKQSRWLLASPPPAPLTNFGHGDA